MPIQGNVLNQLVNKMSWNIARNQRLNANISNFDVPGYKRTDIRSFEKSVSLTQDVPVRINEVREGVEMSRENEMLQITENSANYQANLNLYKKYLSMVKAILGKVGA